VLLLAKTDLKISYLMANNQLSVKTCLRSTLVGSEPDEAEFNDINDAAKCDETDAHQKEKVMATTSIMDNYSKEGQVIGKMQIKISFMRKRQFPPDMVNLLYQCSTNDHSDFSS